MSFTKNCGICREKVGKMENGIWVFYVEMGISHTIINKKICASINYGCQKCVNQNLWMCVSCDNVYDKEQEFCDTKGYRCCRNCIEKSLMTIPNCIEKSLMTIPNCNCLVCQEVLNNYLRITEYNII